MTTEEQQLVERLRGQMAPLKFAADVARPSADGYTYLNDSSRALLLQLDQSVHEVAIAYTASEAKVAELQEALKPFDRLGSIILAEAPPEAKTIVVFTSASGEMFSLQLDYFRAARRALEQSK